MSYTGFSNYVEENITKRKKAFRRDIDIFGKEYEDYRAEWHKAAITHYIPKLPLHLDIELASSCNLRCTMCHQSIENQKFIGTMTIDLATRCIDQAAKFGVPSVKMNWRGEATLNPILPYIISYAKDNHIMEVQLNTNGLPRKKGILIDAAIAGIDRFIFSIDGFKSETFAQIRRGGDLPQLVANIKEVLKWRQVNKKDKPRIRVQFVRQKCNQDEVKAFKRYWEPLVDDVRISDVMDREGNNNPLGINDQKIIGRKRCPQPFTRLTISDQGKVYACCSDWSESYPIGDIKKHDLKELWNSPKMVHLRHVQEKLTEADMPKMCRICAVKEAYIWG